MRVKDQVRRLSAIAGRRVCSRDFYHTAGLGCAKRDHTVCVDACSDRKSVVSSRLCDLRIRSADSAQLPAAAFVAVTSITPPVWVAPNVITPFALMRVQIGRASCLPVYAI